MSDKSVTCVNCGHVWEPLQLKKTLQAVKVNKDGPYCGVCRTLTECIRFAQRRKLPLARALKSLYAGLRAGTEQKIKK
jgi:hypothetical protein